MRLGGIEIPYNRGLRGHSDGDALLHAIADAILGAAGLGSLGQQFPDNDARWRGADSGVFVKRAREMAVERGFVVGNVDCRCHRGGSEDRSLRGEDPGARGGVARCAAGVGVRPRHEHERPRFRRPDGRSGRHGRCAPRSEVILSRLHPIEEAIRSRPRSIEFVLFDNGRRDRRINDLKAACRDAGVPVRYGDKAALERLARGHQGAVARIAVRELLSPEAALDGAPGQRLLFILDEVQDPQNLGAVLRVAEGVGARVVVPERGSAPLSEAVARSSAGAVERVPVIRVGNLRRAIDKLKDEGFRVIGLDPSGELLYGLDLTGDLALVLGAEGKGIRRLVREGCDVLARLPMAGSLASLNVSTAAAAAGFEVVRQRGFPPQGP